MLPLELFSQRNFSVANAQTFAMYGGIGLLGFFVTIYLQQVAGYSALKSGVTGLVPTAVMFAAVGADGQARRPLRAALVSRRRPAVRRRRVRADAALRHERCRCSTDVLPALLVFSLGLALTVAPLTATVLADVVRSQTPGSRPRSTTRSPGPRG